VAGTVAGTVGWRNSAAAEGCGAPTRTLVPDGGGSDPVAGPGGPAAEAESGWLDDGAGGAPPGGSSSAAALSSGSPVGRGLHGAALATGSRGGAAGSASI
jgi:hypothetical protein